MAPRNGGLKLLRFALMFCYFAWSATWFFSFYKADEMISSVLCQRMSNNCNIQSSANYAAQCSTLTLIFDHLNRKLAFRFFFWKHSHKFWLFKICFLLLLLEQMDITLNVAFLRCPHNK